MSKIIRVWGWADGVSIELVQNGQDWNIELPPDMTDGQYEILLYALKTSGTIGVYRGNLYMSSGIACLHLIDESFYFELLPESLELVLLKECISHG